MIKSIAGLGAFSNPFDIEGRASIAPVPGFGTVARDPVALSAPMALGYVAHVQQPQPPPAISYLPRVQPQAESLDSGEACFDTLFGDFQVECFPVYNFWTADEEVSDVDDVGGRDLSEVPRYVRVTWNVAPDLAASSRARRTADRKRDPESPAVASANYFPSTFSDRGVTYAPGHLNDFQLARSSPANGHLSPGTVSAVVEFSKVGAGGADPSVAADAELRVDEDAFLQHPEFDRISLEEMRSNVHSLTNGAITSGRLAIERLSGEAAEDQSESFNGKYSVERPTVGGGRVAIRGTNFGGPSLGFVAKVPIALEESTATRDHVLEALQKVSATAASVDPADGHRVRVNFVSPLLGGLLRPDKLSAMWKPEHAESVAALSQFLPNLESLSSTGLQDLPQRKDIPNWPAPAGLPRVEYVGYVLEKYERSESGAFFLKESIEVPARQYGEYVDGRVKYGAVYRYRIRAVARWTRQSNVGPAGVDQNSPDVAYALRGGAPELSSYFNAGWSKEWAYALIVDVVPPNPPDEIRVRPDSARRRIIVTCRVPGNPQGDIDALMLYRKVQGQRGEEITGWERLGPDMPFKNTYYVDTDVGTYQETGRRYVYAAASKTRHGEHSPLSEQISARLNRDSSTHGEYLVEFVSEAGVSLDHHGAFGTNPPAGFNTEIIVPNGSRVSLSGRGSRSPAALSAGEYVLRFESLDTGETRDYRTRVEYADSPPADIVYRLPSYVSPTGFSWPTARAHPLPPPTPAPAPPSPIDRYSSAAYSRPPLAR